ncbi:MAG: hypothetical protein GY754_38795 [bacterium]|nr:hypothetical protein [bacterium]
MRKKQIKIPEENLLQRIRPIIQTPIKEIPTKKPEENIIGLMVLSPTRNKYADYIL